MIIIFVVRCYDMKVIIIIIIIIIIVINFGLTMHLLVMCTLYEAYTRAREGIMITLKLNLEVAIII